MARIAKKLTDLIGNTPLLELSNFNKANGALATIIGKLEYFNLASSVKCRIGNAIIADAENKGAEFKSQRHRFNRTNQRKYRYSPGICFGS